MVSSKVERRSPKTLKNPQEILLVADQNLILVLQHRNVTTSQSKIVAEGPMLPVVLHKGERKLHSVIRPIDTVRLKSRRQIVMLILFLFHILAQVVEDAEMRRNFGR